MNKEMKNVKFWMIALIIGFAIAAGSCKKDEVPDEPLYSEEKEQALLKEYLDYLIGKDYEIDSTETGLYYVVLEKGDSLSVPPQEGDELSVTYNGYFISGDIFDSSGNPALYGYYKYKHLTDPMIQGWEDGIETMQKGGTSLFIVPSKLGYGPYGSYAIPPYTTLIFSVYLHDVVRAED